MPKDPNTAFDHYSAELSRAFARFRLDRLNEDIDSQDFVDTITSALGQIDHASEGYAPENAERQRDLSIRFHWGHNHCFGARLAIAGRMGDRHISCLAEFLSQFPLSAADFKGKRILDVGCWTGGTSLMLSCLEPSRIVALEEVKKYARMARFLIDAFGLGNQISVVEESLFNLRHEDFHEAFDIIYVPGVIYHVSDPVLALRSLYNCLAIGGIILAETEVLDSDDCVCAFRGSQTPTHGSQRDLNRGGWNWFIPSPSAMSQMLYEAGFEDEVRTHRSTTHSGRLFAYARKTRHIDICRAGLSVPDIA